MYFFVLLLIYNVFFAFGCIVKVCVIECIILILLELFILACNDAIDAGV